MTSLLSITSHLYDATLALVYPQGCNVCGASVESRRDGVVCDSCWSAASIFSEMDPLCWKCGAGSQAKVPESRRESVRCGRCDDDAFDAARACGNYEGGLRATVLELKRQPHVPGRLAHLMRDVLKRDPLGSADLVLPVPLHATRERERGFNQALVLAKELAGLSGLPLDQHCLVRKIQTQMHRGGMDAKARRRSVAAAFEVRHKDLLAGKRVLLIDDVFTTGATASACARVLHNHGAKAVFLLTVARA